MKPARSAKPLVSSLLALCVVLAFVMPFLQYDLLAGITTPFDATQAGGIRYGVIGLFFILWLGVQLFWKAPVEATKLGLTASATILWLSLVLFYGFNPPLGDFDATNYQGAVAFFALMGGLGIVLLWTRFFADDITF